MSDEIQTDLPSINAFLAKNGYQTYFQPIDPPATLEQVVVYLGNGGAGKDFLLRIAGVGQADAIFEAELAAEVKPPAFKSLQFTVALPQVVEPKAMDELARYILTVNSNLDMACFGLMENERVMFYRYVYLTPLPSMNGEIVIAMVNTIQFMVETFFPLLVEVSLGKKTCKQLLQEAKKMLETAEFKHMK